MDLKLTDDAKLQFKKVVRLSLDYRLACELVGLPYSHFIKWIKKPEGQIFLKELEQAKRKEIQQLLGRIKKSAKEGDQAAQAWLRKHCKKFE